jgi:hypothetical protein
MANRYWVGGTGSWNTTSTTNWSASSGGASGASVPTAADSVFFDQASTYTVTMSGALLCLDITVSAGTVTFTGTGDITTSGSMSVVAATVWTSNSPITFNATTAKTITTNGVTFAAGFTFNGTGGSWQLQDALTSSATVTLTAGTLDLNNKTLTTKNFSGTGTAGRTLAFGTGNISLSGASGGTAWNFATVTNLTITGTPVVNVALTGSSATSFNVSSLAEAYAISFNFTSGTYTITLPTSNGQSVKTLDFTGFSGTWSYSSTLTIYGNLTISTGMTLTAATSVLTFGATSGTKTITTNGKTLDFPVTFNGVGGTWQLQDAMTLGSTRTTTLTNGTLDLNGKTLTTGFFSSGNSNTRTIAFGVGNITVNGAGGTLWTTSPVTNLTVTGTPVVNVSYTGSVSSTVSAGSPAEGNAISFNFTAGTHTCQFSGYVKNIDFTGFAGTWDHSLSNSSIIYGNLKLSSGMAITLGSGGGLTFGGTSGTKTITSNGISFGTAKITFDGAGGTWQLQDTFTSSATSSKKPTLTNGTIDLNGQTMSVQYFVTAAGTKNLTFNGGTLLVTNGSTIAGFENSAPTGFTTTAGTGTGKISMNSAATKSFIGGGSTFNCTLSNDGAGVLIISDSSTFTAIANTVQPTTFQFTAGTTQTVTDWNVSGTAGNLVTINSTSSGSRATLSKASGVVSSDYLSIRDSNATGGAAWYAGANSTNVSNNVGWLFSSAPSTSLNSFFFLFN